MEEMCGFHHPNATYSMLPENLPMTPAEYHISSEHHRRLFQLYGSPDLISAGSAESQAATIPAEARRSCRDQRVDYEEEDDDDKNVYNVIKSQIASHPSYPKLIDAYIDCQKVGAPPEVVCLLDEISGGNDVCKQGTVSSCFGSDPELDEFMETYCDVLVKYKSDLARPFEEATMFLSKMETQLNNLCKDNEGGVSSEEEFSGGETEVHESQVTSEERELKDTLLRKFSGHISLLKHEFSKKTKKGKLPSEAREILLEWWNLHNKWPYPTEADKLSLAASTGLDQKQINNWFINQRKRHWKPPESMQLALMGSLSGDLYSDD